MELDHDEPPDGEGEREEDSNVVDHHGEVYVEQHEEAPAQRHLAEKVFRRKRKLFTVSALGMSVLFKRLMWIWKGMYSIITRQSATAMPVRIMLTGFLMSLWVSTR